MATFYVWKTKPPILGRFMLLIVFLLPFALFNIGREALRSLLGWRRGKRIRHAVDVLQATALPTVLYVSIGMLPPIEAAVSEVCVITKGGRQADQSTCLEAAAGMLRLHTVVFGLQIFLFALDIVRFNTQDTAPAEKTD